jgi:ribosomal protein S18 acetylase RimI-like enzyme
MGHARFKMRRQLSLQQLAPRPDVRLVSPDRDTAALGALMLDAFRGTIDYADETLENSVTEMARVFSGGSGIFLPTPSLVIEGNGRLRAATLVTLYEGAPVLAFVMTHPTDKGQGLATHLICQSMNALLRDGYDELFLFVTAGNDVARRLYDRLGFVTIRAAHEA